jgi:hypothetical protein
MASATLTSRREPRRQLTTLSLLFRTDSGAPPVFCNGKPLSHQIKDRGGWARGWRLTSMFMAKSTYVRALTWSRKSGMAGDDRNDSRGARTEAGKRRTVPTCGWNRHGITSRRKCRSTMCGRPGGELDAEYGCNGARRSGQTPVLPYLTSVVSACWVQKHLDDAFSSTAGDLDRVDTGWRRKLSICSGRAGQIYIETQLGLSSPDQDSHQPSCWFSSVDRLGRGFPACGIAELFDVRRLKLGFLTYHGFLTIASSSRIISLD